MASLTSVCKGVLHRFVSTKSATVVDVAPSTAARELFEMQDRVTELQQQIARHQAEGRALAEQLAAIDLQANEAKIRLVGDVSGLSPALDRLDTERREATRLREGIVLTIEALEQQLKPLLARCGELARAADQERQAAAVAKVKASVQRLTDEVFRHWRLSCYAAHGLMETVQEAIDGNRLNLDREHRQAVLVELTKLNARMVAESAAIANEQWQIISPHRFPPNLTVVPGMPREDHALTKAG